MATNSSRIVERLLSLVTGAFHGEELYIWPDVLTIISGVKARSGLIAVESALSFLGDPDARTIGDLELAPTGVLGDLTSVEYSTANYARGYPLSRSQLTEMSRGGLDGMPIIDRATSMTKRVVWTQLEVALAALLMDSATTPFTATALAALPGLGYGGLGTKWSLAAAEPLTDLRAMYDVVRASSNGLTPDTIVFAYDVYRAASNNAEMRSFIGSSAAGIASGNRALNESEFIEVVKTTVEVENVFIMRAKKNTANLGRAVVSGDIATDSIWIGIRGDAQPVVSSGGISVNPTAAAFVEFEPFNSFRETLSEKRGEKVISRLTGDFNAISVELGHNFNTIL